MDLNPLILNAISTLWYFIPLLILAGVFKSSWFKGFIGELIVNLAIKIRLDKNKYHLLKNVTLPTEDGTTQIDHILVSIHGVFVIETKNMKGWIFGSEHQKQWTQKIYKHTSRFQNPLHQNYKHTRTLASCLGIPDSKIHSVIVFVGDSQFKTDMPPNVTHAGRLFGFITSKKEQILTAAEVASVIEKIQTGRLKPSLTTHRNHVKHVQEIQAKKLAFKLCPKCGSEMVQRTSNKGPNAGNQFWGCSQFPKCRAICN